MDSSADLVAAQAAGVTQRESADVAHLTELSEHGAFVVATCTCGWRSYARRSRPRARDEGNEHELLHKA